MPLPTFASLDEVPEAFRPEYEMVDGKAVSKDIAKLTAAIAKERTERETAAKAAKDAEKRAADLELQAKAQKAGMTDEQLATLRAEFEAKVAPERAAREAAEKRLREKELDSAVKSLMGSNGVRAECVDKLWKLESHQFDLTESGTPIVKSDPTADVAATIKAFVKVHPEFFAAPAGSGGAADRSGKLQPTSAADEALLLSNPRALLDRENMQKAKAA